MLLFDVSLSPWCRHSSWSWFLHCSWACSLFPRRPRPLSRQWGWSRCSLPFCVVTQQRFVPTKKRKPQIRVVAPSTDPRESLIKRLCGIGFEDSRKRQFCLNVCHFCSKNRPWPLWWHTLLQYSDGLMYPLQGHKGCFTESDGDKWVSLRAHPSSCITT